MQYFLINILIILSICSCSDISKKAEVQNNKNTNIIVVDTVAKDSIVPEYPNISKEYLLGKINPEQDSMFVEVPSKYCIMRKEYIHKDVLEPFIAMYEAAEKDGVRLGIISAFRSFDTQKWLWNQRYYNSSNPISVASSVLKYLAMPGTSRHHWGTEVDLMSTKLYYYETDDGKYSYQWLIDNAANFGFYQVYTLGRETGYNEEKWHWSYIPIAKEFLLQYGKKITYEDIVGFNGCETAQELKIIEDYVFGIDSLLLE